ncbi:MAG TPA: hypothetical protein VKY90_20820 [Candidatus Dormibacteraeota bacterium]|nr:hypothetical protein [Candidatus Dormibacteraeota bacterium]
MEGSTGNVPRHPDGIQRLLSDTRVLGPSGIERVAWGWRRYARSELDACDHACAKAEAAIRSAGLQPALQAAEQELRQVTHGQEWQAEDQLTGRTAAEAARRAALALIAQDWLSHGEYRALVKPMSEALPWLLPEERPDAYPESPA